MLAPAARRRRRRAALAIAAAGVTFGPAGGADAAPRRLLAAGGELEIEITATAAGFQPKVVRLRKGESVRLVLRTSAGEQCFAVDELRLEKRILPGRDTLAEVTPDRVGSFAFYSCLEPEDDTLRGRLIVAE